MNIYIGNLAYAVTSDDLHEAFGAFGEISRATVITDRETGRSKGFGFVEMPNEEEGNNAIETLNDFFRVFCLCLDLPIASRGLDT